MKETSEYSNCHLDTDPSRLSVQFTVYVKRMALIKKPESTAKPTYINAPVPAVNAWTRNEPATVAERLNANATEATPRAHHRTNGEEYPVLGARTRPAQRSWQNPIIITNNDLEINNVHNFKTLTQEFQKLNSLVNLDNIINLIEKLNQSLEHANSQIDKFIIINKFTSELTDDDS